MLCIQGWLQDEVNSSLLGEDRLPVVLKKPTFSTVQQQMLLAELYDALRVSISFQNQTKSKHLQGQSVSLLIRFELRIMSEKLYPFRRISILTSRGHAGTF